MGIPAGIFFGLEAGLRLAGFGQSPRFLIPDNKPGFFRTNPDFAGLFLPKNFELRPLNFRVAAEKPPNTVRIVVLGESAAQGIPVPSFAFAPQLRAQLRAQYPGKEIEVINTGIVAINSHVVYQIARDLAPFAPDLFIVYLGNNEVVGPYGPGCAYMAEMPPLWVIRLSVLVRSTRTGQLLAAALGKIMRAGRTPVEWGGMAMFVNHAVAGDDSRLAAVYRNFEANLEDIVSVAKGVGAKTLLCTLVSNLKDCPPLLSLHRPDLSAADLTAWRRVFDKGKLEWQLAENEAARSDLSEAHRIDPHYAETEFMLGSLELRADNADAARPHLLAAVHWDALRFRPDPQINEIIRLVARRAGAAVGLVDAAVLMGSDGASTISPAGRELLLEHVHFDWAGNFELARLMAQNTAVILFGKGQELIPWLDSKGCAAAVGYTAQGRLMVLQKIADIVRNPPFTNQLSYGEDQAILALEIGRSESSERDPAALRRAKDVVHAASVRDPENPTLVLMEESLATSAGELEAALVLLRRAQQLLPWDLALCADEASLLAQLERFDEAEGILQRAVVFLGEVDRVAPSLAALYSRMKRFEESRGYIDRAIARRPRDVKLQLMRGNLLRLAGDVVAAERDYRAILAFDEGNRDALEALVSLLSAAGQTAVVEKESLAATAHQTRNQLNNLRVAMIHEARGDEAESVQFFLAAAQSGPVNSAIELRIARKLYHLRRWDEMMSHLAQAKRLAVIEDDLEAKISIEQLIDRVRVETR